MTETWVDWPSNHLAIDAGFYSAWLPVSFPRECYGPAGPLNLRYEATQWRLISSRCDFCEYFSANSLRSRPTSAWEFLRLRCASIILNRGQILRGGKEKRWPPPHLPPRCFPLFTSSFLVAPTAEWEVNGSAAGGQLWDFWPVGKGAKCHLLACQHAALTCYFQWERGFRASRGSYNRRSWVCLRVVPSLGALAHKCPVHKAGLLGSRSWVVGWNESKSTFTVWEWEVNLTLGLLLQEHKPSLWVCIFFFCLLTETLSLVQSVPYIKGTVAVSL